MNKQELTRSIIQETKTSLPNVSMIARYLKVGRTTVATQIVNDLDYVGLGKSKCYYAADVAEKLIRMKVAN